MLRKEICRSILRKVRDVSMEEQERILHINRCIPLLGCLWERRMKDCPCRKDANTTGFSNVDIPSNFTSGPS